MDRTTTGHKEPEAPTRVLRTLRILGALLFGATLLSLVLDLRSARVQFEQLALTTARSFFQEALIARHWNATFGGVYVPVTPDTPPNPFLDDPLRDVVTTQGLRLTKINPAYMTRLISEAMLKESGMQFHITSLKPLRPGNAPDDWERPALESFEKGARECFAVVGDGTAASFRYIAPLLTEAACLQCHAKQGYQLGDVRGGISVTLPYAPFLNGQRRHFRRSILHHLFFLAAGSAVLFLLGRNLLSRIRALEESRLRVKRLEGLLPTCAGCKKIRTAGADPRLQSSWEPFERYIHERSEATFTHGLCPECAKKYFGDYISNPPPEDE